jgi:hypothetical protein
MIETAQEMICDDVDCAAPGCDTAAKLRRCVGCGSTGMVTDCGHRSQPRPIAADERTGESVCDACAELRRQPQ